MNKALKALCHLRAPAAALIWLCGAPAAQAGLTAPFAKAAAPGDSKVVPGTSTANALGSVTTERSGLSMVVSGAATANPTDKLMRASLTMNVKNFNCSALPCTTSSSYGAAGQIVSLLKAYSPSAGSHGVTINFNPKPYDGTVVFGDVLGYLGASLQMTGSMNIVVPATSPDTLDAVYTDNYSKQFAFDPNSPEVNKVVGQSNGLSVTFANGTVYNQFWNWGFNAVLFHDNKTPNAHGTMTADFSKTSLWGGVGSAYDAVTGRRLTDLQLTSSSGVDWVSPGVSAPVPEPSSWALLLVGVPALCGWASVRRTRQPSRAGVASGRRQGVAC